jgi:hypothetical protein
MARLFFYIIIRKPDNDPTVDHKMILPGQLVGKLSAVNFPPMRAKPVDFDANPQSAPNVGEVQKPGAVFKVEHLIFRMQLIEAPECRPPYRLGKQPLRMTVTFVQPPQSLTAASVLMAANPYFMHIPESHE